MKKIILTTVFALVTQPLFAETLTLDVDGMHCSGCKKMITSKVCDDPKLNSHFEKCEVSLTDEKNQKGNIVITTKADEKFDFEAVQAAVKASGEDYKVSIATPTEPLPKSNSKSKKATKKK